MSAPAIVYGTVGTVARRRMASAPPSAIIGNMNGREFIRRARRYARRTGQDFYLDRRGGKGSHAKLRVGDLKTIVQHGEIRKGTLNGMLKDLGIDREEF